MQRTRSFIVPVILSAGLATACVSTGAPVVVAVAIEHGLRPRSGTDVVQLGVVGHRRSS